MTDPEPHIESFGSFILGESEQYVGHDSNEMGLAFSQLDRYLRYLRIIKNRHDDLEQNALITFERAQTSAQKASDDPSAKNNSEARALFAQVREESDLLILEMESFYQFSYIALQKGAMLVVWYFGTAQTKGLVEFEDHRGWTNKAEQYCRIKGLAVPENLFVILKRCLDDINEPRDHDVVHDFHPRAIYGPMMSEEFGARRVTNHLFPNEWDSQSELKSVNDAYVLMNDYVGCLVELVISNRQHSHLRLVAHRE